MLLHADIHNYYERIALEEITKRKLNQKYNEDIMADLCCTILNQLPSRYIRHDIDMAFYLTTEEYEQMQQRLNDAIDYALEQISKKKELNEHTP